jgi:hypothetical protein
MEKVANRDGRDFGWEVTHGAVSRRPPVSLNTMVPRTGGYPYDVGVWDLSIIQGPFSVANLTVAIRSFCIAVWLYRAELAWSEGTAGTPPTSRRRASELRLGETVPKTRSERAPRKDTHVHMTRHLAQGT